MIKLVALFYCPYLYQNGDPKFHLEMVDLGLVRGNPLLFGRKHKFILANKNEYWLGDYDDHDEVIKKMNLIPTYTVEDFVSEIEKLKKKNEEEKANKFFYEKYKYYESIPIKNLNHIQEISWYNNNYYLGANRDGCHDLIYETFDEERGFYEYYHIHGYSVTHIGYALEGDTYITLQLYEQS